MRVTTLMVLSCHSSNPSSGSSNAVETAIQEMFAKLKYAGLDETQPMASSGEHFVNAIVEGHKNGGDSGSWRSKLQRDQSEK